MLLNWCISTEHSGTIYFGIYIYIYFWDLLFIQAIQVAGKVRRLKKRNQPHKSLSSLRTGQLRQWIATTQVAGHNGVMMPLKRIGIAGTGHLPIGVPPVITDRFGTVLVSIMPFATTNGMRMLTELPRSLQGAGAHLLLQ